MHMKIFYVPQEATSYDDVVDLGYIVTGALRWCKNRSKETAEKREEMRAKWGDSWPCHRCGRFMPSSKLQIHHVKPLWVTVLEEILRKPPRTVKEYIELARVVRSGVLRLDVSSTDSVLLAMCSDCHGKAERGARGLWEDRFQDNYPIVFADLPDWKAQHRKRAEAIMRRNGGHPLPLSRRRRARSWKHLNAK